MAGHLDEIRGQRRRSAGRQARRVTLEGLQEQLRDHENGDHDELVRAGVNGQRRRVGQKSAG